MSEILGYVGLALIPTFILLDAFRGQRKYAKQRWWRLRGVAMTALAVWLSIVVATSWANWLGDHTLFNLSGLGIFWGAVVGILVYELVHYWYHRAIHRFDFLWRLAHQMHHSAERIDSFGAYYLHPVDVFFFTTWGSLVFVPLLGLGAEAASIGAVFLTFNAMFQHANIKDATLAGLPDSAPGGSLRTSRTRCSSLQLFGLAALGHRIRHLLEPEDTGTYGSRVLRRRVGTAAGNSVLPGRLGRTWRTIMNHNNAIYRNGLPQLQGNQFVTDGGLETVLVFQKNVDLPLFAAFPLLDKEEGIATLRDYYQPYIELALKNRTGLILDTATWRASQGWGAQLGYSADDVRRLNHRNVELLLELREQHESDDSPMVINGAIGPQDDGYNPSQLMSAAAAEAYHRHQVSAFADSAADMVSAVTMTYVDEAVGMTRAAQRAGIPITVSFTTETDGRLPDGTPLGEAITATDKATDAGPVYYMVNCAHPTHFGHVLDSGYAWTDRIYGIRANASRLSHAELDEAEELDDGNPEEFGEQYRELSSVLRNLHVVGGCCGTDHRHVAAASSALR